MYFFISEAKRTCIFTRPSPGCTPEKRIYPNAFNITVPCEEEGNVINIPLPKHTPIKKTWSRKLKQIFKSSCEESKVDVGLPGSLMVYNRNYWEIKEDS